MGILYKKMSQDTKTPQHSKDCSTVSDIKGDPMAYDVNGGKNAFSS